MNLKTIAVILMCIILVFSLSLNLIYFKANQKQGKMIQDFNGTSSTICQMYNAAADFSNYCLENIGETKRVFILECTYPFTILNKTHLQN